MIFTWFYRLCKKREETVSQELTRLDQREKLITVLIQLAIIAGMAAVAMAVCKALGY